MIAVHLHGRLAEAFGGRFELEIRSLGEAVRALEANFPGRFQRELRQGAYRIVKGDALSGQTISLEQTELGLGKARELHLVPVVAGAKAGGLGQIIIGALLVAAAVTATIMSAGTLSGPAMAGTAMFWGTTTAASVAMLGGVMILGGVAQMLSPTPKLDYGSQNGVDSRASFIFDGPVNTSAQGGAVPLVYGGPIRVGSVIVSASITNARK